MLQRLGIEKRDGYWLWIGGPVPKGSAGITYKRVVAIRKRCCDDQHLLNHELEHVRQFDELGSIGFLARYAGQYLINRSRFWPHKAAYRRIPLEIDAEWSARRGEAAAREIALFFPGL